MKNVSKLTKSAMFTIGFLGMASITSLAFANDNFLERQVQQKANISMEQAVTNAVKAVGGGQAVDTDFDMNFGKSYYEVDIIKNDVKYKVDIDANTGTTANANAKISFDQAITNAVKAVGNGQAIKVDFESKLGKTYYDVEVMNNYVQYDVKIDANTGAVLSKKLMINS